MRQQANSAMYSDTAVVSYTERGERIRLISARRMTARERRAYEA